MRNFLIGLLVGCLLMMTTPALADSIMQSIDVVFDSVEVQVNGEKIESNTILYEGSTYLPMRKVAEAVGKDVNWNKDTMTANIVDKKVGDVLSNTNNEAKVYQADNGYFYAEKNGELYYAVDYVSVKLLNRAYEVDASGYSESILRFYDDAGSFEVSCEVIKDKIFISKEYYESVILPTIK